MDSPALIERRSSWVGERDQEKIRTYEYVTTLRIILTLHLVEKNAGIELKWYLEGLALKAPRNDGSIPLFATLAYLQQSRSFNCKPFQVFPYLFAENFKKDSSAIDIEIFDQTYKSVVENNPERIIDIKSLRYYVPTTSMES